MNLFAGNRADLRKGMISDINEYAYPLHFDRDLDPLMEQIGNSRFVLLGEASHGTHEYYTWRTRITKRLIQEKGFNFIAVEGDWPACYEINRYIKHFDHSADSVPQVLKNFNRWPTWMWANWEIAALVEWLREHNYSHKDFDMVGFYGLDVYSLWESLEATMEYLQQHAPEHVEVAKKAMECFEPFRDDEGHAYAHSTYLSPDNCRDEVVELLNTMLKRRLDKMDGQEEMEDALGAEQNARIAKNAERYYRQMMDIGGNTWNIRDRHMMETLKELVSFHGDDCKVIIWEHNTHLGDARATDMASQGMVNVGQLAREEYEDEGVVIVGFGSYEGSVIAGRAWGAPMENMEVPPARRDSWEAILHEAGAEDKLLIFDKEHSWGKMSSPMPHRAIGVVYHPEREHLGNYVPSLIPYRYDAFVYLDRTQALHPLDIHADAHKMPDTYPWEV